MNDTGLHACRGKLIVITGPSGVGKSTLTRQVLQRTGATFSVSATTRPPRNDEVDGREYSFLSVEAFEQLIAEDALLEWAEVFGHYYGTPAQAMQEQLAAGETVVLEIDVQGGIQVAQERPDAVSIVIVPPDDDELRRRLTERGTESPDAIDRRLAKAKWEIRTARESGAYKHEVVNDDLAAAVDRIVAIVERGE